MQQRKVGIFDIEDLFGPMPRAKQGSSVPSFEAKGLYIDEDEAMSANQGGDMPTKTGKDVPVNKGIAVSADEGDAGPYKTTPVKQRVTAKPIPIEYGPDGPPMRRRGWSCDEAVTMDTNQGFTPAEEDAEVHGSSAKAWADVLAEARSPPQTGPITCVKKTILDLRKAHSFMNHHFGRRNWRIKVRGTVITLRSRCARFLILTEYVFQSLGCP